MAGPSEKGALFRAIKEVAPDRLPRHYREYSVQALRGIAQELDLTVAAPAPTVPSSRPSELDEIKATLSGLAEVVGALAKMAMPQQGPAPAPVPAPAPQPVQPEPTRPDPSEHAGVTLNSHRRDEAVEVDAQGNVWFQKEVNKPGAPRPRGRRILRGTSSGTKMQTITTPDGMYTESFEVPGDPSQQMPLEIKVTLPSYQTGIYKQPGIPFKIHTYQGARGFDWDDINNFYGGADLVPDTVKKVYVSSDLCYDMTTAIRAINDEYRDKVLTKEKAR